MPRPRLIITKYGGEQQGYVFGVQLYERREMIELPNLNALLNYMAELPRKSLLQNPKYSHLVTKDERNKIGLERLALLDKSKR